MRRSRSHRGSGCRRGSPTPIASPRRRETCRSTRGCSSRERWRPSGTPPYRPARSGSWPSPRATPIISVVRRRSRARGPRSSCRRTMRRSGAIGIDSASSTPGARGSCGSGSWAIVTRCQSNPPTRSPTSSSTITTPSSSVADASNCSPRLAARRPTPWWSGCLSRRSSSPETSSGRSSATCPTSTRSGGTRSAPPCALSTPSTGSAGSEPNSWSPATAIPSRVARRSMGLWRGCARRPSGSTTGRWRG